MQKNLDAKILFQKLGNTWYAFSEIDGECVYSPLPEGVDPRTTKMELFEVIEDHIERLAKIRQPQAAA